MEYTQLKRRGGGGGGGGPISCAVTVSEKDPPGGFA